MADSSLDLSRFFELTTDLMCVLSSNGDCLRANSAFERVLNCSPAEVEKQPLSDLTHPDDRATNQAWIERFLSDRGDNGKLDVRMTFRHLKFPRVKSADESVAKSAVTEPNGIAEATAQRVIWIEWRFVAVPPDLTLYCIGRDMTRRVEQLTKNRGRYSSLLHNRNHGRLETALAKQEVQLYIQAMRSIPIGLFILRLDNPDEASSLKMVASNPEAAACTGVRIEPFLGDSLVSIFPSLKDTEIPELYAEVVRSGQPIDIDEVVYGDQRVEHGVFSVKAFPLVDNYLGVAFENITERKLREEDLLTTNLLLTDTMSLLENRNQELDQFAYVASHDLKAPLRAIANLATWIEEDIGHLLPAESKEQFDLLKSRVSRMEGLINGLLAYSRVGRMGQESRQVNVEEMLTGIITSLLLADKVTVEIGPHMPTIQTQEILLSQVFLNLIDNAIRHHNRPDGHIKISVQTLSDYYEFSVSDDGPGIESDYHDKIFAIFQTLKARDDHESTGIGLSIVRKILGEVGGSISVESKMGEGTTFRFTWPKSC